MHTSKRWYAAALMLIATVGLSVRSWVAADDVADSAAKQQSTPSQSDTTAPQAEVDPFGDGTQTIPAPATQKPTEQKRAKKQRDPNTLPKPVFKIDLQAKPIVANDPAIDEKIKAALDKRHDFHINEVPLKDFIEHLQERSAIQFQISETALSDASILTELPISLDATQITLRSALRLVLRPLELNYIVRDGVLLITTQSSADQHLVVRVYPVVDLATPFDVKAAENDDQLDYDSLIQLINTNVAPTTWDIVGGPGAISPVNGTLPISQTQEVHEQIEALLSALRKVIASQQKKLGGEPVMAVEHAAQGETAVSIGKILQQPVELAFDESELGEAIGVLAETSGLNIVLDPKALADAAISTDTPVTRSIRGVSFESALKLLLEPLALTWLIRDEVLLVTTRSEADQRLEIRVYPVGDSYVSIAEDANETNDYLGRGYVVGTIFDSLIETITSTIAPTTWDSVGGPGAIVDYEPNLSLVISQTPAIHRQIERLLADVRAKQHKFEPKSAEQIKGDDEKFELRVYILPTKPLPPEPQKADEADKFKGKGGSIVLHPRLPNPYERYEPAPLTSKNAIDLIRELIDPQSWENENVFVRSTDDRLIIRQTVAVHRKIGQLLGELGVAGYPRPPLNKLYGGIADYGGDFCGGMHRVSRSAVSKGGWATCCGNFGPKTKPDSPSE